MIIPNLTLYCSFRYGSNKKTRHLLPNGYKEMLVHNLSDLELLLMHSGKYAASIAHGVSSKKRIDILARAKVLGVKWVPFRPMADERCVLMWCQGDQCCRQIEDRGSLDDIGDMYHHLPLSLVLPLHK